jgi:hypothetical protein
MKFSDITVGGLFLIDGEKHRKTGPATYVSVENPILGEYTIQPYIEQRIRPLSSNTPLPVLKSVKFVDIKIGDAFTINGDKFEKTGNTTYVSTDGHWPGVQTINPVSEQSIRVIDKQTSVLGDLLKNAKPVKKVVKKMTPVKKAVKKMTPVKKTVLKKGTKKKK